jgi:hypothetical protein
MQNLNFQELRIISIFRTMRFDRKARGQEIHNNRNIFIKFSEADNVHNRGS